jgi:hypothetical protein
VTVQNGALTALVAIVDMIMYLSTEKPYHIALSFLMPKLYSNTILSSLNARSTRLARGEADHGLGKSDVMQHSAAVNGGRVSPFGLCPLDCSLTYPCAVPAYGDSLRTRDGPLRAGYACAQARGEYPASLL